MSCGPQEDEHLWHPPARLARERQLIQDAVERGWPREAECHTAISGRICELLTELGETPEPRQGDS